MKPNIVLATHNSGKVKEFQALLAAYPITIVPQSQLGVSDIEETGITFVENALLKARHAAEKTGLPTIADDSGITINALNDAPGVYSARYAGEHGNSTANIAKVLDELKAIPEGERQAAFHCCLAYLRHASDPSPIICHGIWYGEVLKQPQGESGFGYDPIFLVPEYQCSAAQLPITIKNAISHRAIALKKILRELDAKFKVSMVHI